MSERARLNELEDREAIRQVFTDYARCLDSGDYAGYAQLFARDGRFAEAQGPEAIAARMEAYGRRVEEGRAAGTFNDAIHLIANHDIRVTGDTATADVLWTYISIDADSAPAVYQMGRYNDDLVREDGRWKILNHRINRIMGRGQLEPAAPSRQDALSAEHRELADREAIRQIFTDYARYLDSADFEGYASLFARNGYMKASLGEAVGPVAILELLNKYRAVSAGRDFPKAVHVVANHDVALSGDDATADVLWFYLTTDADGSPHILQGGKYRDQLVREDGAWKLVHHNIDRMFGRAPFDPPAENRIDRLEARLKQTEDREAVFQLILSAQAAMDERDLDAYSAHFGPNADWIGVVGKAVGPEQIRQLLGKFIKPLAPGEARTWHTTVEPQIVIEGDHATAMSTWLYLSAGTDGAPQVQAFGRHEDAFERAAEGWRFTRRRASSELPPRPAVAS